MKHTQGDEEFATNAHCYIKRFVLWLALVALLPLAWSVYDVNARSQFDSHLETLKLDVSPISIPTVEQHAVIVTVDEPRSQPFVPQREDSAEAKIALEYYAKKYGIAIDRLHMGQSGIVMLPETGKKFWRASIAIFDTDLEMLEDVTVDIETKQVVDFEAARKEEAIVYRERYGKLDPDLHQLLLTTHDAELIPVGIWYKLPQAVRGRTIFAETSEPIAMWIAQQGYTVTYISTASPVLFADIPKSPILELEKREDITTIWLVDTFISTPSQGTPLP